MSVTISVLINGDMSNKSYSTCIYVHTGIPLVYGSSGLLLVATNAKNMRACHAALIWFMMSHTGLFLTFNVGERCHYKNGIE
jgi:hypothetical protein